MTLAVRYLRLLLRAFGVRGLARRAAYEARRRSGWLQRRLPMAIDYSTAPILGWHHRFDLAEIRARYAAEGTDDLVREHVLADAERVLSGQLQLYGDRWHGVGWPPRWHVNPFTGYEYPRAHWTEIPDDDPERGDIKDVWELSRLPFTFLFARAHVLTGDDRYVEAWWQAVEDWTAHNPPNTGLNWRCGQETSLRAIALCFGLSAFADHPASTSTRRELAGRILGASVARVRPTVGYALSQRNNHAISELVFLLSVGGGRERHLLRLLREVLDDQFYPDGSYSQQSFTYHRLAVQALQWLLLTRPDLPSDTRAEVVDALARSRDFLARCSDPVSGWLPNYGPNDGALLLHLDTAHYRDFRPLLASLGSPADPAHREPTAWLPLPDVAAQHSKADSQLTTYHTLRGPRSLAFTRIGTGRHRAGHGDQQALDLWLDGHNVVADPGTYRYTAPRPWRNALTDPPVHATLRTRHEASLTLGRFLSEGMSSAELVSHTIDADIEVVVSRRPVGGGWLWRALLRRGDAHTVVDGAEDVEGLVRWNLHNTDGVDVHWSPNDPAIVGPSEKGDPSSGWASPLYGLREPIDALEARIQTGTAQLAQFTPSGSGTITAEEAEEALGGIVPRWMAQQVTVVASATDA